MRHRGQAIVETALVLPIMLVLALGAVAVARIADARTGLDAATAAAASAAARAPSASGAEAAAASAFAGASRGYGLVDASLVLDAGDLPRAGVVHARGSASVELAFAPVPGLPRRLTLHSSAAAPVETWRTR